MSTPWLKFYPRDWRGDQALRAVSIAARGLWMEMLCVMHEASPYGHLVLGGHAVSNDVLARMAGAGVDEVSALLIELESAGVLSRTRKGVIYSRRMVKDRNRAEKGRKAASKRWSQGAENLREKPQPNRSANSSPTTQKPETRIQIEEKEDAVHPPTIAARQPIAEAVEIWNEAASLAGWPVIRSLSETRRKHVRGRLRSEGLDGWRETVERARSSGFLGHDPPPWFTFDFFIKPDNFLRVQEGNYDRKRAANGAAPRENPIFAARRALGIDDDVGMGFGSRTG